MLHLLLLHAADHAFPAAHVPEKPSAQTLQPPTRSCCQSSKQAVCQSCAAVAGASAEPQTTAAVKAASSLAARPSWVRPQQQPTAVAPPAAEQSRSDAEPATQLYPAPHTTACSPPDHGANVDRRASWSDHVVRPWAAGIAAGVEAGTEAGIQAGIQAGAAVQAGSTEGHAEMARQAGVTDKPAQMTHKPLVFNIEDSCDDAEGDQAQPAFVIDIDDLADEPPAQMNCGVAPAAPSSAQAGSTVPCASSPNPHANAQRPSAAPNHTQAALNVAGIISPSTADKAPTAYAAACITRERQQATQHAHRPPGLSGPCLEPCPIGPVPTDAVGNLPMVTMGPMPTGAMGSVPINPMGPMPIDAMGLVPIDAMGAVPIDALTVPDTPPYSHASHVGSPTGPTWLSPMLTKQHPGQGKQYSPSMLGRPAGMLHMDTSLTHAASVAASQVLPSSLVGPYAAQAQRPLLSQLPEGQRVRVKAPAAACVGKVQSQAELGHYIHPHRQSQAASQLPGSIQSAAPAVFGEGRSPGHGKAAAATGVLAAWNRQEANDQPDSGPPDAAMPQANVEQLQDRRQQLSSTATLAAQAARPCAIGSIHGQPRWASPLQRHQEEDSAAAKHLLKEAATTHADPGAEGSAELSRRPRMAEEAQADTASIFHISHKVLTPTPASTELNFYKFSSGQTLDRCFLCRHVLYLRVLRLLQRKVLALLLLLLSLTRLLLYLRRIRF